jgi:hypothetical protein
MSIIYCSGSFPGTTYRPISLLTALFEILVEATYKKGRTSNFLKSKTNLQNNNLV